MKILTIDYNDKKLGELFTHSLHNSGFAVIKNHPIKINLINKVYDDWQKFFASNDKHKYLFDYKKQDGYFPFKSESAKNSYAKDLKEFFHLYRPWGRFPKNIDKDTIILYNELLAFGKILLKFIDAHCSASIRKTFSEPLFGMCETSKYNLMRIIHYPPLKNNMNPDEVRAAAHTDINLITLLISGSQPGLQIKDKNNEWIEVKSKKGQIVINIGDMLQECSNGYYPSTIHRVINPSKNNNFSRYSIPLFLHPRADVILSKKYTADSYLLERLRELGLK